MCYEYDWMQEVTETQEAHSISKSAEKLTQQNETAPPPREAQPVTEEPVPA